MALDIELKWHSCVILLYMLSTVIGYTYVVELSVEGKYESPNCNVAVTCRINTDHYFVGVVWSCKGGPPSITDLSKIPGFKVGSIRNPSHNRVEQTITISKCYEHLLLECSAGDSSKSVTLSSGVLSVRTIVGIIFGVLFAISLIAGIIIRQRRKALAKAPKTEAVALNPPPGSYPSQTYSQVPVPINPPPGSYPSQISSQVPLPINPPQQAPVYPSKLTTNYSPQASAYSEDPATAYPKEGKMIYTQHDAISYPQNAKIINSQELSTVHLQQSTPLDGQLEPLLQNPPPYASVEQRSPAHFK